MKQWHLFLILFDLNQESTGNVNHSSSYWVPEDIGDVHIIFIAVQLLIGLSFERPYLIKGQKLMILHADFAAENCRLWSKTADYGQKLDYGWKLQIMVENWGLWSKTTDFGRKLWILVENQILQFLSLKLQNCLLVFSPERGSKG